MFLRLPPADPEDVTCCRGVSSKEAMNKDEPCVSPHLIFVSIPDVTLLLDTDRRGGEEEGETESKGR